MSYNGPPWLFSHTPYILSLHCHNTDTHTHTHTHTHTQKTHTQTHTCTKTHTDTQVWPFRLHSGLTGLKGPILTFHIIISIVKSTLICTAHRKVSFLELTIWKLICSNSAILMFAQLHFVRDWDLNFGIELQKFPPGDEWSGLPFHSFQSRITYYLYAFIRVTATVNLYYLYCTIRWRIL